MAAHNIHTGKHLIVFKSQDTHIQHLDDVTDAKFLFFGGGGLYKRSKHPLSHILMMDNPIPKELGHCVNKHKQIRM